jgi:hypothetical protein
MATKKTAAPAKKAAVKKAAAIKPSGAALALSQAKLKSDANSRFKIERVARQDAQARDDHKFLLPDEVRGDYDKAKRQLFTTLGGGLTPITQEHLRQFAHTVRDLEGKMKGGITPKEVIDMARHDRVERAQEQIKFALPVSINGAVMRLMTNAGPDSKVARHYVDVQFIEFPKAVASPKKTAGEMARALVKRNVLFQCSCEDHRYMWRYIATVGGWNYGRPEVGFPKIKNPSLKGVSCKHVIRVMRTLGTPLVTKRIESAINSLRKSVEDKEIRISKADLDKDQAHQERQVGKQAHKIETSTQRADRLAAARALRAPKIQALAAPKPLRSKTKAGQEAEERSAMVNFKKNLATIAGASAGNKSEAIRLLEESIAKLKEG